MTQQSGDSKKKRFVRAFEAALPRLQAGEHILLPLDSPSMSEWETVKTYWYQWRKMQQVFNPQAHWLANIKARMQHLEGQMVMLLVPPGGGEVRVLSGRTGANTQRLDRLVSAMDGQVQTIHQTQASPEQLAEIEARQALALRWASWMEGKSRTDLDPTRDPALFDWYKEPWDSARAVAFREQFGG